MLFRSIVGLVGVEEVVEVEVAGGMEVGGAHEGGDATEGITSSSAPYVHPSL